MNSIFDIIGPIIIGPSSSHTAGAARLGKMARCIFRSTPKKVDLTLYGSFAKTYKGHGTDRALIGGLLGYKEDDKNILDRIVDLCDTSNMIELPLDKDGEVIRIHDVVYDNNGMEWEVREFRFPFDGACIYARTDDNYSTFRPDELTHKATTIEENIEEFNKAVKVTTQYVEASMNECVEAMKNNSEIARLNSLIKNEVDILAKIEAFEKRRDELDKAIEEIQKEIISKYKEYSNIRTELLNDFKIEDDDLKISVKFSLIDLEDEFYYINARGRSKQDFIEKMIGSFEEVVDSIFDEDSLAFNGNKDKFSHIEHFLTTNFYKYSFVIEYQGDKFEQMSPGKKAFIVLKLILEFSDSKIPVLIDQPEDSLDNRAIYTELTKYIKETKEDRQIIIVTHNPNIVVSGDAENIIVANQQSDNSPNQNGKKFDYINGALENRNNNSKSEFILQKYNIREHVCDILEGGEDAFMRREKKYSINR